MPAVLKKCGRSSITSSPARNTRATSEPAYLNVNDTKQHGLFQGRQAVKPFDPGNKARTLQQQQFFDYTSELVTRMPKLRLLLNCSGNDFNIDVADFPAPTPAGGGSSTRLPTKTREDLATVLAPTVADNAAIIVQDNDNSTGGVTIFSKLAKAYGHLNDRQSRHLHQQVQNDLARLRQHNMIRGPRRHPTKVPPRLAQHVDHQRCRRHHTGSAHAHSAYATAPELRRAKTRHRRHDEPDWRQFTGLHEQTTTHRHAQAQR